MSINVIKDLAHFARKYSFIFIFLTGCKNLSDDTIKEKTEHNLIIEIKNSLISEFAKGGNDIDILELNKLNGIKKNIDGYESYIIFFSAKLRIIRAYNHREKIGNMDAFFKVSNFLYTIKNGTALFISTDNGWACSKVDYDLFDLLQQKEIASLQRNPPVNGYAQLFRHGPQRIPFF